MVRATRYLEIIEEEQLLGNATRMGERLLAGLREIAAESGGRMTNVRGQGLILAFDLPDGKQRDTMLQTLYEEGLYALKCGSKSVRFRPTLDVPAEVVDAALEIVVRALA